MDATTVNEKLTYADASEILQHRFVFFSPSTFTHDRHFNNRRGRLKLAIEYLINHGLIHQASGKTRFIKGAHDSYAMATPGAIKKKNLSLESLAKLNLNIDQYEELWARCILPSAELAIKLERTAVEHIKMNLEDYVRIIHRLGNANDPIAQDALKPGLLDGEIGVDFDSKRFSLKPEHFLHLESDHDVMEILGLLCARTVDPSSCSLTTLNPSLTTDSDTTYTSVDCLNSTSQASLIEEDSDTFTMPTVLADDGDEPQREGCTSLLPIPMDEHHEEHVAKEDESSMKECSSHQSTIETNAKLLTCSGLNRDASRVSKNTDDHDAAECASVLEEIQGRMSFTFWTNRQLRPASFSFRRKHRCFWHHCER